MKVEKPSDLIFWTYHMVNWTKAKQTPSVQKCVQCGREMMSVGPVEDSIGSKFEGLVCHSCKRVIWARSR